jgi:hypothetical protein
MLFPFLILLPLFSNEDLAIKVIIPAYRLSSVKQGLQSLAVSISLSVKVKVRLPFLPPYLQLIKTTIVLGPPNSSRTHRNNPIRRSEYWSFV